MNLNKYRSKRSKFTYDGKQILKIGAKELKPLVYLRKFDFTDLSYYKSHKYGIKRAVYQYIGYSDDYNLASRTSKWTRVNINKGNNIGKLLRSLMQMNRFKSIKQLNKYLMEHTRALKRYETVEKAQKSERVLISINKWWEHNSNYIICLNERDAEVQISKEGKYIIK